MINNANLQTTSRSDMTAQWYYAIVLLIKFLGGLVVAKKPYLMQTVRLALRLEQPTCMELLICIYNLTNDETFILWDTFN